jgi:catechol 2,3-dioxygenase-like lactoylglutathione lyase family enzyme
MAHVILGNHSAIVLPRTEQDRIRRFYRDVLGCEIIRETDQKDDFRMGDNFYIGFSTRTRTSLWMRAASRKRSTWS